MRVFKSIIILLFFIQPILLKAETEFHFRDGTPQWHQTVKNKVVSSPSFNNDDSLHLMLINFGFPNNKVVLDNSKGSAIIEIEFGNQFFIGDLIIEGDKNDTIIYNKNFVKSEYESLIDSILENYKKQGNYFVNLLSPSYRANNNKINIHLYLQTGPIVTVSSVEFFGIKNTDPELLKRYINISENDMLNYANLEDSWERLKNLDYVSSVEYPEIIPEPGYNKARVRYNLSETKLFNIEGAGGYVPDDNGSFVGYLDFKLRNYFGGGRAIGLLIDKKEKSRSVQQLLYSQPFFLLGYGRTEFSLSTRDFRGQFYEFSLNGTYNFEIGRNLEARFNLGWKNLEPSGDIYRAYEVYNVGFGLKMGEIGKKFNSSPQFFIGWEIGYYARFYKGGVNDSVTTLSDINDTRNRLTAEVTYNLFNSTLVYHKADFMDLKSSEKPLPISERFLFGGLSGLRGYRNDQFSARRLLLFEFEPRLYFSPNNYFYPFADAAYYEYYGPNESGNLNKFDDFIFGYGFGFNLISENRSFDITLSWGEESPFGQPRLNIVLSNNF